MLLVIGILILVLVLVWILYQKKIYDWVCSSIVAGSKRYRCQKRPKRIILVRHGESQGNHDTTIYATVPDHAIGLTEKGQEQARKCGCELKSIIGDDGTLLCYVSPFRRSKETCDLICEAFSPEQIICKREDPRIREQEW